MNQDVRDGWTIDSAEKEEKKKKKKRPAKRIERKKEKSVRTEKGVTLMRKKDEDRRSSP